MKNRLTSRGKKTDDILQFIFEAGSKGRRYTDIIRFAYEYSYGKGSYDANTVPTKTITYGTGNWKYRVGGNPNRGYWSGAFTRWGHLTKYLIKNDKGNYILRDKKTDI